MLSEGAKKAMSIAGATLPVLGAMVAVTFWVDDRYAHAEDFNRSMAQQNLITQESLIELRLEQNSFQTRSAARRLQQGSGTTELDMEEMEDLRANREALKQRHHDIRMQLQMLK